MLRWQSVKLYAVDLSNVIDLVDNWLYYAHIWTQSKDTKGCGRLESKIVDVAS